MFDFERASIVSLLQKNSLAVISTIDSKTGNPEAALISYAENSNSELFFGTFQHERKYQNLKKNPTVALVIGWDHKIHETLQYEGVATELKKDQIELAYQQFKQKTVSINTEEYLYHPHYRFFMIKPTWIRYSNYVRFELKF